MHANALTIPLGNEAALTINPSVLLRAVLEQLPGAISATMELNVETAIGAELAGGIYAGLTIFDGRPHQLVLLPGDTEATWVEAQAWARAQGGALPSRFDLLVLWDNLKREFQERAYWSSEPVAGAAGYAWIQYFYSGYQHYSGKDWSCRARAVRRVPT